MAQSNKYDRTKIKFGTTLPGEICDLLQDEATRRGKPISFIVEDVLRQNLGRRVIDGFTNENSIVITSHEELRGRVGELAAKINLSSYWKADKRLVWPGTQEYIPYVDYRSECLRHNMYVICMGSAKRNKVSEWLDTHTPGAQYRVESCRCPDQAHLDAPDAQPWHIRSETRSFHGVRNSNRDAVSSFTDYGVMRLSSLGEAADAPKVLLLAGIGAIGTYGCVHAALSLAFYRELVLHLKMPENKPIGNFEVIITTSANPGEAPSVSLYPGTARTLS